MEEHFETLCFLQLSRVQRPAAQLCFYIPPTEGSLSPYSTSVDQQWRAGGEGDVHVEQTNPRREGTAPSANRWSSLSHAVGVPGWIVGSLRRADWVEISTHMRVTERDIVLVCWSLLRQSLRLPPKFGSLLLFTVFPGIMRKSH